MKEKKQLPNVRNLRIPGTKLQIDRKQKHQPKREQISSSQVCSIICPKLYASGANFCILGKYINCASSNQCRVKKGEHHNFPSLKFKITYERMATYGTKEDEIKRALSMHTEGRRSAPSKAWLLLYIQFSVIFTMFHYCSLKNWISITTLALGKNIAL